MLKIVIIGMRHGHISDVIARVKSRADIRLVGICEEDDATRAKLDPVTLGAPVYDSAARMLDMVACDIVGVGDYYSKRGAIIADALRRGKHVISDKPLCTRLSDYEQIAALAVKNHLCIGAQLDLRDNAPMRTMRAIIAAGDIGEVHALHCDAQHPLLHGKRPGWYFEPGKHGGTINDIGIHTVDALQWLTGHAVTVANCARNWNAKVKEVPHFKDAAQFMLTLANGAGVLSDMSYFSPDSLNYSSPFYWQITAWGSRGVIRSGYNLPKIQLVREGDKTVRDLDLMNGTPGGYFEDFLADIAGHSAGRERTTASILESTRMTLLVQMAADDGTTNVSLA